MIKTVKVKKSFRLDELIKYIFDNGIKDKTYGATVFDLTSEVRVSGAGNIKMSGYINEHTTFTVEVEEEITEDTEFEAFVVITDKRVIKSINNYHNMRAVRGLLENYEVEQKVYALIDNNLQLIWEAK